MDIEKKLIQYFDSTDKRLTKLWKILCQEKFLYQEGSYPAGHGKKHIINVLSNLKEFLDSYGENAQFSNRDIVSVFAAAMIHDVNMVPMRSLGASGKEADIARDMHAMSEGIQKQVSTILKDVGFTQNVREDIIAIASTHASDSLNTLDDKIKVLKKRDKETNNHNLVRSAILVQVSDFFDIGGDRLTGDVDEQGWDERQKEHYKKHVIVRVGIDKSNKRINLWFGYEKEISVMGKTIEILPMEQYEIMSVITDQACFAIDQLNDAFNSAPKWNVEFDKTIFGEISPMGKGVNLFKKEFERAYNDWIGKRTRSEPFPVDLMGHSLHGRFVNDEEDLNKRLREILGSSGMDLRVLVLDTGVENQQMCEVYDGQCDNKQEKGRAILPLYDHHGEIAKDGSSADRGDILNSLGKLDQWLNQVGLKSSMEVRTTTRLMYMSISRYGNTLIVTPYRRKGLFNDSISLVFRKDKSDNSPLFNAYCESFEDTWSDRFETTLKRFKNVRDPGKNPVMSLLPGQQVMPKDEVIMPFDYERFFLDRYHDRIKAVFDNIIRNENNWVPPIEIEIQPSEECTLHCAHCIGRHINQELRSQNSIKNQNFASLLDYQESEYKVERFRISGLVGDPLSNTGRDVTLGFIKKAKAANREVVLLTNGVQLKDDSELLLADYIHVSVDAATRKTFHSLKGDDCFDTIRENIKNLCNKIYLEKANTKVGIGFVVTQRNASEVNEAIDLAKDLGVSFIRFKPDIRGMQAIAWRNWKEAFAVIKRRKQSENGIDIIITETGRTHYRVPVFDQCWSQYFYCTVGADSKLYQCDHLTTNKSVALDYNDSFRQAWQTGLNSGVIGRKQRECFLCPPLSWRLNRLIGQLFNLYKDQGCKWSVIAKWIFDALGK